MNEPTLAFACPVCGSPMLIPDSLRGRELQCPHENCGAIFQTPALDEPVTHVDDPAPEATDEAPGTIPAAGAKSRRKQLPTGPGLKRKNAPAGPRPARTAASKPAAAGDNKPSPATPPAVAVKKGMGTGTKLSYLLGVVIVVGVIIYNKTAKRAPAPAGTIPAPAAAPARSSPGASTPAPRPVAPAPAPAGKKKGKELTDEQRNRFNESLIKADEEQREEDRKAFQRRLERAGEGSRTAQYDVGMMYLHGPGVEPDRTQAREWLQKAAAQDYPPAFNGLAELAALENRRDEAIVLHVKAGHLSVQGFKDDDSKAKAVVYKALEQLDILGAKAEHDELAAKTTRTDEPKDEPAPPVAPPALEMPPTPPAPEPAPVLDLPPLPDPPPPAPGPDAPPDGIKEP